MVFGNLLKFLGLHREKIGVDLGTVNTLVYIDGEGVVINEPSVIAVKDDGNSQKVIAVGDAASDMLGRTPMHTKTIEPIRDGFVSDFDFAGIMIKHFIKKALGSRGSFLKPRMVICLPSGATPVERRAIIEAAELAGAGDISLIEEPVAAALGAGLPVLDPTGSMLVDIGGGTTDIAIISLGGIVHSSSLRVAGNKMDEDIISYVKENYNLLIGRKTAESIKMNIGRADDPGDGDNIKTIRVCGRDAINGIPKEVLVSERDVFLSLQSLIGDICDFIRESLECAEPEITADIANNGIVLAGGGSLIKGIAHAVSINTGIRATLADKPIFCTILGAGAALQGAHFEYFLSNK